MTDANPQAHPVTAADQPPRRATIRDVALRAGVATSTVSRALSNPGRVHPATRERIADAVRAVDYRAGAQRLAAADRAPGAVALLLPDIANPFYAELTRGMALALSAAGVTQLLADTEESASAELRALGQVTRIAQGVVLAATRLSDEQLRTAASQTPVVLVNREMSGFASVCLDSGLGFRQGIEHLRSLGHTDVAYLAGPAGSWSDRMRWSAIRAACRGTDVTPVRLGPFAPTFAGGAVAADALLNREASACLAFNDLLAIGVMRRLSERGIAVPAQMSVVGCDDIFAAELCVPALTTVTGDLALLGRRAVQTLFTQIQDPAQTPDPVMAPTHLTIRESTGARADAET